MQSQEGNCGVQVRREESVEPWSLEGVHLDGDARLKPNLQLVVLATREHGRHEM